MGSRKFFWKPKLRPSAHATVAGPLSTCRNGLRCAFYLLQRLCQFDVKRKKVTRIKRLQIAAAQRFFSECSIDGTPRVRALHRAWHSGRRAFTTVTGGLDGSERGRSERTGFRAGDFRRTQRRGEVSRRRGSGLEAGRRVPAMKRSVDFERLQFDRCRHVDRTGHALARRAVNSRSSSGSYPRRKA